MKPDISIIIVTYNSEGYIRTCVDSLIEKADSAIPFEIIILDNASKDSTINILHDLKNEQKNNYVNIRLFLRDTNLGFSRGCNVAASHAESPRLVFLNPDTVCMTEKWNKAVGKAFMPDGIVGFRFILENGKPQYTVGRFPMDIVRITCDHIPLIKKLYGTLVRKDTVYPFKRTVDWVCGCGLMISKETFNKFHGFDEAMFMYWEEMDLCYRARVRGIYSYYIPDILFIHSKMSDLPGLRIHKLYNSRKNLKYFLAKNNYTFTLVCYRVVLFGELTLKLLLAYINCTPKEDKQTIFSTFRLIFEK